MTKTSVAILAIVVAVVAVVLWRQTTVSPEQRDGVYTIGAVLPLTGDAAVFGVNADRGARLAVETLNSSESGIQFAYHVQDSRGEPVGAVAAAQTLIDIHGVDMLLGDVTSAGTHALLPVAERAEVCLVSPSASDPALTGASALFARVWTSDVYESALLAELSKTEGYQDVHAIVANTAYGVGMAEAFAEAWDGGFDSLELERGEPDYRPAIRRVIAAEPDAILLVVYPEDGARFLRQYSEFAGAIPVLGTATMEDPAILALPSAEGLTFTIPAAPSDENGARTRFEQAYRERYGAEPGSVSDTAYDAVMVVAESIQRTGNVDGANVARGIRQLRDFDGVSGTLTFDAHGDVRKPYRVVQVQSGALVELE